MNTGIELQQVLNVLVAVGFPTIIMFYLRDRRKNKAETVVAERTVEAQVDLSSISAIEAHIGLVERAYKAENDSLRRRLTDCEADLTESERQVEELRAKLKSVQEELEAVRGKVDELNAQITTLLEGTTAS